MKEMMDGEVPRFLSELVPRRIREGFLSLLLRSGTDLMPIGVMSLHFSGGIFFTKLMCPQDMPGNFSEYFMCRVMHEEKVFQKEGPTSGRLCFWECPAPKVLPFKKIDHQIKLYGRPRCAAHYRGLFCLCTGFSDGVPNLAKLSYGWSTLQLHHKIEKKKTLGVIPSNHCHWAGFAQILTLRSVLSLNNPQNS